MRRTEGHELAVAVPGDWTPEDLAIIQKHFDEVIRESRPGKLQIVPVESGALTTQAILRVIDDWAQDYFGPVSWPEHTRDHVFNAVKELRNRIQGLVP